MKLTSMRRAIVPGIAALALALTACGGGQAGAEGAEGGASGSVAVDGSSTVFPLSDAAAELLAEENPDVQVSVGSAGTGGGFEAFCADQTDISDASRPIEEDEAAACKKAGIEYTELTVALDALTLVVHPDLAVDCLTTEQVVKLWEPGSDVTNWSDLDPSFPDQEISLFGPGTDSGTYDYMAADVIGDESETTRDDYEASEDDNVLVQGVAGTEGATGYFGYTYYEENQDSLKALAVDDGQGCVEPSAGDRCRRDLHPAVAAAVHLREQRQVRRQRSRRGLRRLLHREPHRDRRDRGVHPPRRRAVRRDAGRAREHRRLTGSMASSTTTSAAGSPHGAGLQPVSLRGRRRPGEAVIKGVLFVSAMISIVTTVGIIITLIRPSLEFFAEVDVVSFLTGTEWAPTRGEFGIYPLVKATLLITLIALLVAVPIGLGAAMFLSEYASRRTRKIFKPVLELLAGVPSVVYGFFALAVVTPWLLQDLLNMEVGFTNALAAGLVLGVMIIPTVASLAEDAMSAVPLALRQGSLAMGANRMQTTLRVVFPAALSGIGAAIVLGLSRAVGETMIVALASGALPSTSP